MIRRYLYALLPLLTSLLLISCGDTGPMAEGGIGGTGISMGRVSQIGSVYVNGIHYNTDNTTFVINGSENNNGLSDIGVGMVVRVAGTKDTASGTGVADRVDYDSLLVGPVDVAYDTTKKHISVMGQEVHVNADTVLDDHVNDPALTVDQLPVGTIVEISGYPGTESEILATRIEVMPSTSVYKVTGAIGEVSTMDNSFTMGKLTIDASSIAQSYEAGGFVRVEGPLPPSDGYFVAETVAPVQTDPLAGDGEELSVEGMIIDRLDPVTHLFTIKGYDEDLVVDASRTAYSQDEMALAAGRTVKVDGVMNKNVLLAETIEPDDADPVREEIAYIVQAGDVDPIEQTVTLLGKTVHVTNLTILQDTFAYGDSFKLAELEAGDYLKAQVVDNNGELTATKIELDYAHSYNAKLEGTPTNLGGNRIEILGVEIDTSGIADYHFRPRRTEVKGNYDPGTQLLTATEIEEDD